MVVYLMVVYFLRWKRTGKLTDNTNKFLLTQVFDSATFSGSVMLLWGIMDQTVLQAIGSTKPFLLVAGLAGVFYGLHSLIDDT
ncbi:MAG: hypothetical protein EPO23_03165 [Xanthobacteraceae bacterium]|nr:MAG: hypothetical protein EPO23_03165 [Xanthobacteraceae bacterium]